MENVFTASWIKGKPAFWIKGKRVSKQKGFEFAEKNNVGLPAKFLEFK